MRSYTTFSYSIFQILWLNCSAFNLLNRQMPVVVFEYFDLNVSINKCCTRYFLDPWHFCCTWNDTHPPYHDQEKYHTLRWNKWAKMVNMRKFWRNPQQMNQPQSTNMAFTWQNDHITNRYIQPSKGKPAESQQK